MTGEVGKIVKGRPGVGVFIPGYQISDPVVKIGCATHMDPSQRNASSQNYFGDVLANEEEQGGKSGDLGSTSLRTRSSSLYGGNYNIDKSANRLALENSILTRTQSKEKASILRRDKVYSLDGMKDCQSTYSNNISNPDFESELRQAAGKNLEARLTAKRQRSAPSPSSAFKGNSGGLDPASIKFSASAENMSTYRTDIGGKDSNPLDRMPSSGNDFSLTATTRDL